MSEEICIIFITILTCSLAFDLSCPGSGQWNFRASFYCSEVNKYTCLLDATKTRYTETCDGFREETEGVKSTINRNNFDATKCRPERFQPIGFTTVGNSDCVFKKSKCVQEGQIVAHEIKEESSLVDTKCLCDYTKGYSFINLPKDKCYCSPSVDDCSCFREFCSSGKKLSPDYQCNTEIDMKNRTWNCSNIAYVDDGQNGDQVRRYIEDIDPQNGRRSRIAVQVIVPITVVIMVGLLIWCWRSSISDKIAKRISCLDTLFRHGNNSKTSFPGKCSPKKQAIFVPINDCSSDQNLHSSFDHKDRTVQEDNDRSSEEGSYHSALSREEISNEIDDNKGILDNSPGTIEEFEICQNEENKIDTKSESYEKGNSVVDEQSNALIPKTETQSSSREKDAIDQNDDLPLEISEKEHEDKHDESVKAILTTEADNGKKQKSEELKTSEDEHEVKGDESLKAIFPTDAENGKSKEYEAMKTYEKQHNDQRDESVESISASEAEDGKNEESEELEKNKSQFETKLPDKRSNEKTADGREEFPVTEKHFDILLDFDTDVGAEQHGNNSDTDEKKICTKVKDTEKEF